MVGGGMMAPATAPVQSEPGQLEPKEITQVVIEADKAGENTALLAIGHCVWLSTIGDTPA